MKLHNDLEKQYDMKRKEHITRQRRMNGADYWMKMCGNLLRKRERDE